MFKPPNQIFGLRFNPPREMQVFILRNVQLDMSIPIHHIFLSAEVKQFLAEFKPDAMRRPPAGDSPNADPKPDLTMLSRALGNQAIEQARRSSAAAIRATEKMFTRFNDVLSLPSSIARKTETPLAFERLMRRLPNLAADFRRIANEPLRSGRCPSCREMHRMFLRGLRAHGVRDDEYPFTTSTGAYKAFCAWIRRSRIADKADWQ